jgi:hypothetical protein
MTYFSGRDQPSGTLPERLVFPPGDQILKFCGVKFSGDHRQCGLAGNPKKQESSVHKQL